MDSPTGRFEAYLDAELGELERVAAVTAAEIKTEAANFRTASEADPVAAEGVDGVSQRVSRNLERIAEEISRLRVDLGSSRRGYGDEDGTPSAGAELLVRQLANAGADASEIETELAKLGMEHPRGAIDAVLAEPH
jgi:hypothetical protein